MNTGIKKSQIIVEHHCLGLPYAPIRLHKRSDLNKLVASIAEHNQLVPIVIVPSAPQHWVLMDGYLRVKALQLVGKDTANAEVWECEPAEALLILLIEHQSRPWEVFEEALLLRELQIHYGLSQQNIATRIGRDRSWISRRLTLIDQLPDSILQAVLKGRLSPWIAQRILAPVARATQEHADRLLSYLLKVKTSTREVQYFYDHYQQANCQERLNMVNDPELFFKAHKLLEAEKKANHLRAGPEGKWKAHCSIIVSSLAQLTQLTAKIFYANQPLPERTELLKRLKQAQTALYALNCKVEGLTNAH